MKPYRSIAIIAALAIATMFANIGGLDIYALDEAKNAEAARYMFESGDYVVPYYNGDIRTDKPPLHYYFMAAGYQLFGVNAFGARFLSSLFGVLTVIITFLFVQKHFNQRMAIFSSVVLICSLHFNLQMHMSVPDPYLIFFTTWAFLAFYEAYKTDSWVHKLAYYFAIGCGILLKGPIAIGLPGLTALLFLIINKDFKWKTIWRLQPFGGLLLSLAVSAPWYYAVHKKTNGFWTEEFFFKHNFSRFSDAMEGHEGIFLMTFAFVFLLGMLTFFPFVFQSLKFAFQKRQSEAMLYCLIGVVVVVGFFSVSSTKLPNYTVPSYPLLAVLLGVYLSQLDATWFDKIGNRVIYFFYAVLITLFPVGIYFGLKADPSLNHLTGLFVYFIPLSLGGILLLVNGFKRTKMEQTLAVNSMAWLVTILLFFYFAFPQVDAENPVRKLVPKMDTSKTIVAYERLNPAFVFALEREIPRYPTIAEVKQAMADSPSGYVISRTNYREALEEINGLTYFNEAKDLFENPTTLIMKWGE
ncbi:ArnT family glycosyltransferase [Roseivirga pacifica]|uniref:ArnT family glycosyltransferase n=1 Tax=Roseivirga pacifica TaxID=1267423 RepID=UPI002095B2FB|nr:glycosyltransferase family 39 protein [Roseivirga pacifica]MCO6360675.1 phospholipid carrier-dependent glycosyltransferase [Roseivirga pacifica]MCO6368564.1 phospholipid carrier-dependent glycosyltransferase [Roseivirga pacifica]MCO6372706.1 phospholipid carrier-dependent glycosyltransferase [Roseivirga pacifica]MCO6376764.1 phospholipid carrier-dependent glycosyltransferase [Roseivirga pacifica]MCO6377956.1 phospholipid carrier-dependent glycosyltransferase [Roseivirga pacifica]